MSRDKRIKRIIMLLLCVCICTNMIYCTSYAAKEGVGVENEQIDKVTAKNWPDAPGITAEGAVLIDADTGTVLYAKNADNCFYPASITKIMTGLLAIENCNINTDTVTFNAEAVQSLPIGYVSLNTQLDEKMSLKDCLYGLLMYSANDCANGIAVTVGETIDNFADMMNTRAKELGCRHTHFINPNGLHDESHYTTPYDMAMIMKECIRHEEFLEISGAKTYTISKNNKRSDEMTISTRHEMLQTTSANYYKYAVCGKTGHTTPAGYTLVTYAQKDGMNLICCVMQDTQELTYADTRKLFEYGFNKFKQYNVADSDGRFTLKDSGIFKNTALDDSQINIEVLDGGIVILPASVKLEKADTELTYLDTSDEEGSFAQVTYTYQGMAIGSAKLRLNSTQQDTAFDFSINQDTGMKVVYINTWYVVIAVIILIGIVLLFIGIRKARKKKNRWIWKEK